MFPIVLNHIDDDDEALLNEANHADTSGYSESSPLFQDNLRCTVGRRIARQFSITSTNRHPINQSIQPGERIIEIKGESDDEQAQSSSAINEYTSLINDYRFQRFRPIRIEEQDLNSNQDPQTRVRRNYQVLRSKKRFTFPICFFLGLYISFLLMSSFIFTMFEQKIVNTDSYFNAQRQLMLSLTEEQFALVENLVQQSIQMQKGGLDVMSLLYENKFLILEDANQSKENSNDTNDQTKLTNNITETTSEVTTENTQQNTQTTPLLRLSSTYTYFQSKTASIRPNLITSNQLRNRRTYNWDFQQALFFVVSIATTIGYILND